MVRETSQWEREDMEKVVSDCSPNTNTTHNTIQTDVKHLTISKYLLYNLLIHVDLSFSFS